MERDGKMDDTAFSPHTDLPRSKGVASHSSLQPANGAKLGAKIITPYECFASNFRRNLAHLVRWKTANWVGTLVSLISSSS
jgi:hypothetical protein